MAAGTRRLRTAIGAGAVNENILAGQAIEFPGRASQIEIASVMGTGGTAGDILMDVQFGTDLVAERMVVPLERAANEGPIMPDHLLVVDALAPADRLIIRLTNTSAGALNVDTLVRVQPV